METRSGAGLLKEKSVSGFFIRALVVRIEVVDHLRKGLNKHVKGCRGSLSTFQIQGILDLLPFVGQSVRLLLQGGNSLSTQIETQAAMLYKRLWSSMVIIVKKAAVVLRPTTASMLPISTRNSTSLQTSPPDPPGKSAFGDRT